MKIYLIRHAQAFSKEEHPERPLNPEGRLEAEKIAKFLKNSGEDILHIFHSTKLRAMETAQIISKEIAFSQSLQTLEALEPEADLYEFIEKISLLEPNTLLVGHLPNLEELVNSLLCGKERSIVSFMPASAVSLINRGTHWTLDWMVYPEILI